METVARGRERQATVPPPTVMIWISCSWIRSDSCLCSMRLFASLPLFSKLVVRLVSCTLSAEQVRTQSTPSCDGGVSPHTCAMLSQLNRFRLEFNLLDQDGSGTLSLQEVQALGSPVQAEAFADLYCATLSLRMSTTDSSIISGSVPEMTYGEYLAAAICGRYC